MRPSARLLAFAAAAWFAALWLPVAAAAALWGALALAALVDALRVRRRPSPQLRRELPTMVPVGHDFTVSLTLRAGGQAITGTAVDLSPDAADQGAAQAVSLPAGEALAWESSHSARRRGSLEWHAWQWTARSPWRLWWHRRVLPLHDQLAVYPDYARSRRQLGLSNARSLRELGVSQRRVAGQGQEFHQLRDYQRGDSLRQIDWKATARREALTTREYADERNQSLVVMIDCGRRMRLSHGHRALLDEAIDAALMLAEVALRQGDSVALQCFAERPVYWSGPVRAAAALNGLMNELHRLSCSEQVSDYALAGANLRAALRRRSTVLLITHSGPASLDDLQSLALQLGGRHQLVVVDLLDRGLSEIERERPADFQQALRYLGALGLRQERREQHQQLRRRQCEVIDTPPERLVPVLVDAWRRRTRRAA